MPINLYIVCVLYNKKVDSIRSLDQFLKIYLEKGVRLIIVDNSDIEDISSYNINYYEKEKNEGFLVYKAPKSNVGLSKAYNIALNYIRTQSKRFALMLSDDDTFFSIDYLKNAFNKILDEDVHIVSGLIKSGERYYSPVKKVAIYNFKSNFINKEGLYEDIICINSGLVLDSFVCEGLVFNEDIFLMMGDYWLMEYLSSKQMNKIYIVSGEINQQFSVFQDDKNESLRRYKMFKQDFKVYCRCTGKSKVYEWSILLKRRIHIMFMH